MTEWFEIAYIGAGSFRFSSAILTISRKFFIGSKLNIPNPEDGLNGILSSTAIAVYNGAHIVRTHDRDKQLFEMVKMAEEIRRNQ